MQKIGFLGIPEPTVEAQKMFDEDIAELGYVMNVSRLWAYQPGTVGGQTAAAVVQGVDDGLSASERAMAAGARKVARDPNGTTAADVQELRAAGFSDSQIFTITAFVALRLAFSTVNDALGLRPDAGLRSTAPAMVRDAVTFGRPIEEVA